MSLHTRARRTVKDGTAPTPPARANRTSVAMIDGEPYIRASDAARIYADAGVPFLTAGKRLREHVQAGDVRAFEVHPRAYLYAEADVRAAAERYRSA